MPRHGVAVSGLLRAWVVVVMGCGGTAWAADVLITAATLRTMGPAGTIDNGAVYIEGGQIKAVGTRAQVEPMAKPETVRIQAVVATPGLIDARCTVGLSGILNAKHDSDQLEHSGPVQPELRAIDAFNPAEPLVAFVRSFGVTTIHTGHAPGELVSGQTLLAKTTGAPVNESVFRPMAMVVASLGAEGQRAGKEAPGTRAKEVAMLRAELIKAQEYRSRLLRAASEPADGKRKGDGSGDGKEEDQKKLGRDLRLEALGEVLSGQVPLAITANKAQDISAALRLAEEFKFKLVIDGGAEAYTMAPELKKANVAVLLHAPMARAVGELANATFASGAKLRDAGLLFAYEGGYEAYVPKARVILFEAAMGARFGLTSEQALAAVTINAATLLGAQARIGSLETGKDGDVACFDGDPLEYTSHCTATVIGGRVFPGEVGR